MPERSAGNQKVQAEAVLTRCPMRLPSEDAPPKMELSWFMTFPRTVAAEVRRVRLAVKQVYAGNESAALTVGGQPLQERAGIAGGT